MVSDFKREGNYILRGFVIFLKNFTYIFQLNEKFAVGR